MKLKEIRLRKGFSQTEIAKKLDVSHSAYNQIENEKYKINIEMLGKLADILECSTDEILDRAGTKEVLERNAKYYNDLINNK